MQRWFGASSKDEAKAFEHSDIYPELDESGQASPLYSSKSSSSKSPNSPSIQEAVNQFAPQGQGYLRHLVASDGDCGYTSFGITREYAASLLQEEIDSISNIIKVPTRGALLIEDFYNRLLKKKIVTVPYANIFNNDQLLEEYSINLQIQRAYIQYDVKDKKIDSGYSHPAALQALAHIRNVEIHMWRLGERGVLVPHNTLEGNYAVYIPENIERRVDILFVNNNHFELLDLSSYENNIPENGIYPLKESRSQNATPKLTAASPLTSNNRQLVSRKIPFSPSPIKTDSTKKQSMQPGFSPIKQPEVKSQLMQSPSPSTPSEKQPSTENVTVNANKEGFMSAIRLYYQATQPSEKTKALHQLIKIVTKLSEPSLNLNVRAPIAIAALEKKLNQPITSIDEVYSHLYTILQAVLATEKNHRVDTKIKEQVKNAREVIVATKDILKWLADADTPDALKTVHDRMITRLVKNFCGDEDFTAEKLLTQLDQRECNEHDRMHINSASPLALEKLHRLHFRWHLQYVQGVNEENSEILEQRRYLEAVSAFELKQIMQACDGKIPLSLEQQWLLVTAITDYDEAMAYLRNNPKKHIRAVSPFYNAIQLLALERGEKSDILRQTLSDFFIENNKTLKADNLEQQVLQKKMAIREQQLLEKASKRQLFATPEKSSPSVSSHSSAIPSSAVNSRWNELNKKYGKKTRLNKEEIIDIFKNFDAMCHVTEEAERSHVTLLLDQAFAAMEVLFKTDYSRNFFLMWSSENATSPQYFNDFMNQIMPKSTLPPYIFARFCDFQLRKETSCLRYEYIFIRTHLHCLYDSKGREALKGMKNDIAPIISGHPIENIEKTVIGWIYPKLNNDLMALETKLERGTLLAEEVEPYKHLQLPMVTEKSANNKTVLERINALMTGVEHNSSKTPTISTNKGK